MQRSEKKQKVVDFLKSLKQNRNIIYIHFGSWFAYYMIDFGFILTMKGAQSNNYLYLGNVIFNTLYFYTIDLH